MKIVFYLAHPAHFHLFKDIISRLEKKHNLLILYNDKDVLASLIKSTDINSPVKRIKTSHKNDHFFDLIRQFYQKNRGAYKELKQFKPDVVVGTPILISLIGFFLKYTSIIVNEDDFDIIKLTANIGYPFADYIVCPDVCRTGKFESKCIKYPGYHELAYLHPNNFKPNRLIADRYVDTSKTYFIIRFAKLKAHHDKNIRGINKEVALGLVEKLRQYGEIYISSERSLEKEFEKYRISIKPEDIHHVMSFASLYIGDSQTMAAESGVLGVPFIRYNDFVNRISYLNDLEKNYGLGVGILPDRPDDLIKEMELILNDPTYREKQTSRRKKMLLDKIDVSDFLYNLLDNFPQSVRELKPE